MTEQQEIKVPTVELVSVDLINLNDWNPNFVPIDMKNAIADDIKQNGFLGSIVLQKWNERLKKENVIINGEHRYLVFKEMGGTEIPAVITDVDDDTAQILTIRLNREHGELLPNRVGDILHRIAENKQNDFQEMQRLTFIKQKDLVALINLRKTDLVEVIASKKSDLSEQESKSIKCPQCGNVIQIG